MKALVVLSHGNPGVEVETNTDRRIATPYVRISGGGVIMGKYASSYFWGGEWLEIGGNPGKNRRKMREQKEISSNSVRICQAPR